MKHVTWYISTSRFFLKHDLEVILGNYIIVKSDKMYLLKITIELSYLFSNCQNKYEEVKRQLKIISR